MRPFEVLALFLLFLPLPARGEGADSSGRQELLDAPGGKPVAILLPAGAALPTGETRDGFMQVAVVGWVRLPSSVQPGTLPRAVPVPAAPAASALSGLVAATLPSGEVRYGSGARVAALGPATDLERSWNELKDDFGAESAALDARVEDLRLKEKNALSSSDNLTQASHNLEQARSSLKQAERERLDLRSRYASQVDELFRNRQVAETVADADGRYVFSALPAGSYRILAVMTVGDSVRRWFVPVEITPAGGIQRDLRSPDAGPDPYFGTR
jgi:hypothetical protein